MRMLEEGAGDEAQSVVNALAVPCLGALQRFGE